MTHIAVIGAGQAAVALLAKLRALGFDGALTLIGDEPTLPYQRPPLSKKYLLGELAADRLQLRPQKFYDEHRIALRLGVPVSRIDTGTRTIVAGKTTIGYDKLALTTGSRALRLPAAIGGSLRGVHAIRTLADVDALAPEFCEGRRLLIVGGGYIGLEAAAVAARKGLRVTLVEVGDRILARVAAPETSGYFRDLHRREGVTLLEGTGLDRLTGTGQVSGAILSDGQVVDVDFVIAGVGVRPATALAETAGIVCDNGIAVDERGRTSAPGVWAAGDCTSFPWRDTRIRLECVQNAVEQAETVAADMLDRPANYAPIPWFWSDQFDTKLQMAGLSTGYDRIVTRRNNDRAISVWYYRGGTFCAVDAIDDSRAYMVGKQLLQAKRTPDPAMVCDPASDLKLLLR